MYRKISMVITITVFGWISYAMLKGIKTRAKKYKCDQFEDRDFSYAKWAIWIEVVGITLFVSFFLVFIYFSDPVEINHPLLYIFAIALTITLIFRTLTWRSEIVKLRGERLFYYRRNRRIRVVYLYKVESVDLQYFRFIIHMKDGSTVVFPTGFKDVGYIYAVLDYHSLKNSEDHSLDM